MSENKEILKKELNPLMENRYLAGAVDMKVIALTGLLLEKGIITEKEVHQSYVDVIKAVKTHGDETGESEEKFVAYLTEFLQINKKKE